jgi:hypothetical protein
MQHRISRRPRAQAILQYGTVGCSEFASVVSIGVDSAVTALSNLMADYFLYQCADPAYTTWFGAYSATRYQTVAEQFFQLDRLFQGERERRVRTVTRAVPTSSAGNICCGANGNAFVVDCTSLSPCTTESYFQTDPADSNLTIRLCSQALIAPVRITAGLHNTVTGAIIAAASTFGAIGTPLQHRGTVHEAATCTASARQNATNTTTALALATSDPESAIKNAARFCTLRQIQSCCLTEGVLAQPSVLHRGGARHVHKRTHRYVAGHYQASRPVALPRRCRHTNGGAVEFAERASIRGANKCALGESLSKPHSATQRRAHARYPRAMSSGHERHHFCARRAGLQCAGLVILTGVDGYAESNAVSTEYQNNANCSWRICPLPAPTVIMCARSAAIRRDGQAVESDTRAAAAAAALPTGSRIFASAPRAEQTFGQSSTGRRPATFCRTDLGASYLPRFRSRHHASS